MRFLESEPLQLLNRAVRGPAQLPAPLSFLGYSQVSILMILKLEFHFIPWNWKMVTDVWNNFKALSGLFVIKNSWKMWEVTEK